MTAPFFARCSLLALATMTLTAVPLAAQDATPPAPVPAPAPTDVNDFRIAPDGTVARPTPREPVVVPAPAPAPAPPVAAPAPAPGPGPVDAAEPPATAPARRERRRDRREAPRSPAPVEAPQVSIAADAEPPAEEPLPPPTPVPVEPVINSPSVAAPPPAPAAAEGAPWWPWALLALAGLGGLAFAAQRRRRVPAHPVEIVAAPAPEADLPASPPPSPAAEMLVKRSAPLPMPAVPAGTDGPVQPRLEIEFKPAAAAAGDSVTAVEFGLTVANRGTAPARRVRMEARMFAMGRDHDAALAAFFAAPLERPTPIASAVAPGVHAALRSQVTLPRAAVQPLEVRNRQLFVPLVAFKLLYEWDAGDGNIQTSQVTASYVVGREANPPSDKMAPFRLDQGPKMYREVGQRVHRAA